MGNLFRKKLLAAFTLVETIVVIFIFSLAITTVSAFAFHLYRANSYTFQQSQAIFEARKGIEEMVREIREASNGEDGSFLIEEAQDNEFIFYSDINRDGKTERVRYFISPAGGNEGSEEKSCQSSQSGGSCSVDFSNFLSGDLDWATVEVSVDGDLNASYEKIYIYADGQNLGTLCNGWGTCSQCKGSWQALTTFDVTDLASDNSISFTAQASSSVDPICDGYSFEVKFVLHWKEKGESSEKSILKKGVIEPIGWPPEYPLDNEKIYIISRNVMNSFRGKALFSYYDKDNNLLPFPARIEETTFMCFDVIVNIDPNRPPNDFDLSSCVQLRNIKTKEE